MISKEQFNSVWKDTSREGILNQFYYEHMDLRKYISVLDEIRELLEKDYSFAKRGDIPLMSRAEQLAGNLFKILDKVKE
jgi:hypothetical protein